MKLLYAGNRPYIQTAVDKVNSILSNPAFFEKLGSLPQFDNTVLTPAQIAAIMMNSAQQIEIKTGWRFNPLHPFRCVNASTNDSKVIDINTRCFSHDLRTAVNTLIHESTHAADFLDGNLDFTHFDNENDGDEDNTAPWAIGKLAESFVM